MNYIELINRYWQEVDIKGFTPVETTIYFRLLDVSNRLGWKNPFSLSNPRAVALMAVTENTLAAGRDKLAMKGLIAFRKGSRRKDAPTYCFPEKIDGEWVFPDGFTSDIIPCFASNIEAKTEAKREVKAGAKREVKSTAYNKTKTETETVVPPNPQGGKRARAPVVSDGLFSEREMERARPKGVKASQLTNFTPPTIEEVRQQFYELCYGRNNIDWESEANAFFAYYDSQGWVKSNGRKVANWESLANDWILRKEREQHQPIRDGADKIDRLSERRGSESGAKSRKGFKGKI